MVIAVIRLKIGIIGEYRSTEHSGSISQREMGNDAS